MKRRASDGKPRPELTDAEWKKVKEYFASRGHNADDEWETYKKNYAGIGIYVTDNVKAELFGDFAKTPVRDLTDDEWEKIKKCLAHKDININADTVRVHLWGRPDSLRETVPCLFRYSDVSEPRYRGETPRDVAKKQTTAIKHIADLQTELTRLVNDLYFAADLSNNDPEQVFNFPKLTELVVAVQPLLHALVPELTRCRDNLMAMGASRGEHLRETHREFWKKLARIFDAHVDDGIKYRNQHKIRFLQACSAPYCPKEATVSALTAFVEGKARAQISRK
jgi:hypothetical protein